MARRFARDASAAGATVLRCASGDISTLLRQALNGEASLHPRYSVERPWSGNRNETVRRPRGAAWSICL